MRGQKRSLGVLATVFLLASIAVAPSAGAATTYNVQVGAFHSVAPAESMAFFPGTIDVHEGDTLRLAG